ncbi:MAG: hypothetical protein ETSY2_35855, partial [Candidatus Entotheonella gemina]
HASHVTYGDLENGNAPCGVYLNEITWHIEAANRKAFHYTNSPGDMVVAKTSIPGNDHFSVPLNGTSDGALHPLVEQGKPVHLGSAQVIKPTQDHPELRLRITPPKGLIYAPANTKDRDLSALLEPNQDKEEFLKHLHLVLNPDAAWPKWYPVGDDSRTNPGGLYAQESSGASLDFLDDSNDGLITVAITGSGVAGPEQKAHAGYTCCPQDFQPDRRPFTSTADGLSDLVNREQVLDPAYISGQNWDETEREIADFMQRVRETMEGSNLDHQNLRSALANNPNNPSGSDYPFPPEQPRPGHPLPLTELGRM